MGIIAEKVVIHTYDNSDWQKRDSFQDTLAAASDETVQRLIAEKAEEFQKTDPLKDFHTAVQDVFAAFPELLKRYLGQHVPDAGASKRKLQDEIAAKAEAIERKEKVPFGEAVTRVFEKEPELKRQYNMSR